LVLCAEEVAQGLRERDGYSGGLARAFTGDTQGAIEDFEAFVGSDAAPEMEVQRREWVNALRKGQHPFTTSSN